jgi:hypothetical protein
MFELIMVIKADCMTFALFSLNMMNVSIGKEKGPHFMTDWDLAIQDQEFLFGNKQPHHVIVKKMKTLFISAKKSIRTFSLSGMYDLQKKKNF